jgi:hypothetical protein
MVTVSAAATLHTNVTMKCPSCGSANVAKDALAHWDETTQSWEICGTYDNETCLDCEAEGDEFLLRVPAGTGKAASQSCRLSCSGGDQIDKEQSAPLHDQEN